MTLGETLFWLTGAGLGAWMLGVSKYLSTEPEWFLALESTGRNIATWVLSLAPPILAFVVIQFVPAEFIAAAEPTWAFISALLTAFLAQQGIYLIGKMKAKPIKPMGSGNNDKDKERLAAG